MNYIIMDLEWNTAFCRTKDGFINEIIEIGAVKLNDALEKTDTFSMLIKPAVGKRLQGRVKALTHLSNADIQSGVSYREAMQRFAVWVGSQENIFLSWGDGDIRTMLKNHELFLQEKTLPFVRNYVDIQRYCQNRLKLPAAQQVGLSAAAEKIGIDPETYAHHRALDDSLLTADCFRKLYSASAFEPYVVPCNAEFYARLAFKPYYIRDMRDERLSPELFHCTCDVCGGRLKREKNWRFQNHAFSAVFYCKHCDRHLRFSVRCKQLYDRVDIRKTCRAVVPEPTETVENQPKETVKV